MLDTIAAVPPQYLFGASFLLGLAAWLVSLRHRWWRRLRWRPSIPLFVRAALGGLGIGGLLYLVAPYARPFVTGVRTVPSTCAQARAWGYGTARVGEPGYFAHLDADWDGISCEPLPSWRR